MKKKVRPAREGRQKKQGAAGLIIRGVGGGVRRKEKGL